MMSFADLQTPTALMPDYTFVEIIYQGSRTTVYRMVEVATQKPVVIKTMAQEYPSFSELVRFRNQYTVAKNLPIAGIIHPFSLEPCGNGYGLVMEDMGGIDLAQYAQQQSLSLTDILDIAIQLADILHDLHQSRVIHKDIKPANILIHPDSKQIKLIDFSIASLLPKETQAIQNPKGLEGTLAYLAPEQTGRMNRAIDYRADYYALGVTLYQLLTGQLPFSSHDPMELIHSHMTQMPMAVNQINPDVPSRIAAIVAKLMAKNAEDRYQSALGLKYDLEQCLSQWQDKGEITDFILGQRDLSDRFTIPEKLYGRETEVQTLLDAFERVSQGSSELMLVAGFSGIGKTVVVNEVHKPIVRQRGYFIKGKFDQFNRNIPFSAFVQAFRDLMGQLLSESDQALAHWQARILDVVGDNGQVLIDVIPELEQVIGPQPMATELVGTAAQNRFNLLFQRFITVFTTPEHPLVMFLDDLQWADSASLNLMKVLMGESEIGYLLLLGAYRDNEIFPAHPLILTLGGLKKQATAISTINLPPLSTVHINQLIAETLKYSLNVAWPLTELVYQQTQGNPFFTTQCLQGLHKDSLIKFNITQGSWEYDLDQVQAAALTDDVVAFMASRLQKLAQGTQQILKLAACIGNQFDLETLAIVCESRVEAVAADLWAALREGLIIPITEAYKFFQDREQDEDHANDIVVGYRFLHDRVQQAAYSLIPSHLKEFMHVQIGRQLLQAIPLEEREDRLLDIVNQLNQGSGSIKIPEERHMLVTLNLAAAQKVKVSTAYGAAMDYLNIGIQLLPSDSWQQSYELTLGLYELAAEVACLSGDFSKMDNFVDEVLHHAHQLLDQVNVYEAKILAYVAQSQQLKAIETALSVLELFGITFPKEPTQQDVTQSLEATQAMLAGKQQQTLLELPAMVDPEALAAIRILASMTAGVYVAVPPLLPLVVFKQVQLSVQYGNTAVSASAYAWYGLILCGVMGAIDEGNEAAELALSLLSYLNSNELKASTYNLIYPFVKPWKYSIEASLKPLVEGYHSGLEHGALEYAGYCAWNYCYLSFFAGQQLSGLGQEMLAYSQALGQLKQVACNYVKIFHQSVLNWQGESDCPWKIQGNAYEEDKILSQENVNDLYEMAVLYISKLILCYSFQQWAAAQAAADFTQQYLAAAPGSFKVQVFHFYDSLIQLIVIFGKQGLEQTQRLQRVQENQTKLKKWADQAPMNFLHKWLLVEAEQARVLGQKIEAIEHYEQAISVAKENGYIQEEALANELTAKFYLDWGKKKVAATYMQEAYYCYARWDAKAKIDQLTEDYPDLLAPILQKSFSDGSFSDSISKHSLSTSLNMTANTTAIDLISVVKASQTLSGSIEFDVLLSQLMHILLENAGADSGSLILNQVDDQQPEQWTIVAQAIGDGCQLVELPFDNAQGLPLSILNRARRSQSPTIINNIAKELDLAPTNYLKQQIPQSLFCSPILNQGRLIGILYLENYLAIEAFTTDRVEILNLITTQAAISIENAYLYKTLERKVEQRTEELSQALDNLKATQTKLVESEKMAALGGLVAGVAHEINTPIGTSITLASTLVDETESFAAQVNQGQLKRSVLNSFLAVAKDSSQLMLSNLHRAGDLIQSFKQIAVDQGNLEIRRFNLKQYIEEVSLSLAPKLKPTPHQLTVSGKASVMIESCPGALAQVVTNLTMNSINHGYPNGQPGKLTWQIQASADQVTLMYQDDGCGISAENLAKVFDPFFTTARHSGGTGLGLHIVYNLVTQTLQGTIEVESELGKGVHFAIILPQSINPIDQPW